MIRFQFRRFVARLWSASMTAKRRPGPPRRKAVQPLESRVMLSVALVNDINRITLPSDPQQFTEVNGTLYFTANNGLTGEELWKSDGTSAGTVLVRDIRSGDGTSSSTPRYLTNVNGTLYFRADDGLTGTELW